MKRVITGERDGREVFLDVTEVGDRDALVIGGLDLWGLWGQDLPAVLPYEGGAAFEAGDFHPGPGGIRMTLIRFGASLEEEEAPTDESNAIQELMKDGGMHSTDTLDICWVISGELGMELESGEIEWFNEGDLVVQNGTRHKWHNRSGKPALTGWVVLGAQRQAGA